MNIDLNKLSKEIYEANKAKGFHDEKNSKEHMLCLVVSELMEAVEADRKCCRADMEHYVDILGSPAHKNGISDDDWFHLFQHTIKDSVEDELADAVIRLLDTAGALDIRVGNRYTGYLDAYILVEDVKESTFTENIFYIVYIICYYMEHEDLYEIAIYSINKLCESMNIDLCQHVELKLKYNSLRPYKHGKKY